MQLINLSFVLAALFSSTTAVINDPVDLYVERMCYPIRWNLTHTTKPPFNINSSLAKSPFPCEQSEYLTSVCFAKKLETGGPNKTAIETHKSSPTPSSLSQNHTKSPMDGTTELDLLAEQECLCAGNFFQVNLACSNCYLVHGYPTNQTLEYAASYESSISIAKCAPTPPFQPFQNIIGVSTGNYTSQSLAAPLTLGHDQFPNNTAVSNYYKGTELATAGSITGSATTKLTSYMGLVSHNPTSIQPKSGISQASLTSTGSSSVSAVGAAFGTGSVGMMGGFLAVGVGVVGML